VISEGVQLFATTQAPNRPAPGLGHWKLGPKGFPKTLSLNLRDFFTDA